MPDPDRDGAPRPESLRAAGVTHWSSRRLADWLHRASGISVSHDSISVLWRKFCLQPHRTEGFKFSTDPQLEAKVCGSGVLGAAQPAAPTPAVRTLEGWSGLNAAPAVLGDPAQRTRPAPAPLVAGIVGYELAAGATIRLAARPLGALAPKIVNPLRPAATWLSAREQYVFNCSLSHPIRPAPGRAALLSKRRTCSNRLSSVV